MKTALHIFPPDVEPGAPPAHGTSALASGPRHIRLLRELGWKPVDLIAAFSDGVQRMAMNDALIAADDVATSARTLGLDTALIDLLQSHVARFICAWRRFESAAEGAETFLVYDKNSVSSVEKEAAFLRFMRIDRSKPAHYSGTSQLTEKADRINRLAARTLIPGLHYVVDQRSESGRFVSNKASGSITVRNPANARQMKSATIFQGLSARRIFIPLQMTEESKLAPKFSVSVPAEAEAVVSETIAHYVSAKERMRGFLHAAKKTRFTGLYNELFTARLAGTAMALKEAGHKVILLSHGSMCVHGNDAERKFTNILAHAGLNWSAAASHFLPRSPVIATAIPEADKSNIFPSRFVATVPAPNTGKPFRILHAGNYVRWGNVAYVAPAESEYLQSLLDIAEAVEANPTLTIQIRIKTGVVHSADQKDQVAKQAPTHVGPDLFEAARGWSERVTRSAERRFDEALAAADLVISEGLTATMHEALESGKPVLLHSLTARFPHMAARIEPPSPGNRAAVYACSSQNLAAMLEAIRLAHENLPLTEAEIAPYRWPRSSPGVSSVLETLISENRK